MSRAVLLDLDDTLLGNPGDTFTEQYLALLARFMRERLGVDDLIPLMIEGIRAVFEHRDPLVTNWQAFFDAFEQGLPVPRAEFDAAVADFYADVYPALRGGTTLRPAARQLVTWLHDHGHTVAVATNPFFPRVAVEQRLTWADCTVGDYPFALVTTLENMHFAKPNPAYYEEILARIGAEARGSLMVGDDWARDILPARQTGLNTFWIASETAPDGAEWETPHDGAGTLDHLLAGLRGGWLETLTPRPLAPEQIAPRLLGNVAALAGLVSEAPPEVWQAGQGADLIDALRGLVTHEPGVRRNLERTAREEKPSLDDAPPPAAPDLPGDPWALVEAFAAERQNTLGLLAGLDADAWTRPARHPTLGATTLLDLAQAASDGDRQQIALLRKRVAACDPHP